MELGVLRNQIATLLKGGHAHMNLIDAVKSFPEDKINDKAPQIDYTFYALLEHIRFTQHDILDYIFNPNYIEPEWPKDYWPPNNKKATKADWETSIKQFKRDVEKLITIAQKEDLFAKVPNNETILRELFLVIDHNAYHIGEFAILRQVTNTWDKNHE